MAINIKTEKDSGLIILHIQDKRLDAHNSSELRSRMSELVESGEIKLVVELSDVNFIDSSGLGVLLSGHKIVSLKSGTFTLTGLQSQVRSMFELTRLNRVFDIRANLRDVLDGHK